MEFEPNHHFSSPVRALGRVCDSVCLSVSWKYEMIFNLDIWYVGLHWPCLGQVPNCRSKFTPHLTCILYRENPATIAFEFNQAQSASPCHNDRWITVTERLELKSFNFLSWYKFLMEKIHDRRSLIGYYVGLWLWYHHTSYCKILIVKVMGMAKYQPPWYPNPWPDFDNI